MMSQKLSIIHERGHLEQISQISPSSKNIIKEYSLTQNVFDPSSSSPPNEFMLKLKLRMAIYNNSNNYANSNDNLDRE